MPVNSRAKGKRGELEWVHKLKEQGYEARRTAQFQGTVDSFDVVSNGPLPIERWEVKRGKRLNVFKTMEQSREEAEGEAFGLAWRKDGEPWLVILDMDTFFELVKEQANG